MATEFVTQRDGSGRSRQLLPPGETLASTSEAPALNGRGFLVTRTALKTAMEFAGQPEDVQPRKLDYDVRLERPDLDEEAQDTRWRADCLPPREVWKVNPSKPEQLIETPTDEFGLIDIRALILQVRETVEPEYRFIDKRKRNDHLYWPNTAYGYLAHKWDDELPLQFINLPQSRAHFPLVFERWKHAVTVPADYPSREVMRYTVDSWGSARDLYRSVYNVVFWERRRRNRIAGLLDGTSKAVPRDSTDMESSEFILDEMAAHNKGIAISWEQHQKLPTEFRILQPEADARDILRVIGYQIRNRCRDGLYVTKLAA